MINGTAPFTSGTQKDSGRLTSSKGKSLSLICGSLTWLREHKRKVFEDGLPSGIAEEGEPAWIVEHARQESSRAATTRKTELETKLAKLAAAEQRIKERFDEEPQPKKRKLNGTNDAAHIDGDARYALDDYESEADSKAPKSKTAGDSQSGLSAKTRALMQKLGMPTGQIPAEEEVLPVDELKVLYCSRTHSQLTQFINELRRVSMPPSFSCGEETQPIEETLKHLTLGSRKHLCINPKVSRLEHVSAINERCLELQQSGQYTEKKCQYLPTKETEALVHDFRDNAIAKIRDIEDLGELGRRLGICPYYASRSSIKPSEIVTLPYPLLLQKSAREALELSLKDQVVIIDEAHNLMENIIGIHSISISLSQLKLAKVQLMSYLLRFRNRLKGSNRVYVTQLTRLIDSLMNYLQVKASESGEREGLVGPNEFLGDKGVDQMNFYKLMRYVQESKIARKVEGYALHVEQAAEQSESSRHGRQQNEKNLANSMPVLSHIQSFLLPLTNLSDEGRFFFEKSADGSDILLRYILLDPTECFREVVEDARAVILVGGTMSPMSDYVSHLLSWLPSEQIMTLSCGHVIPSSNLFACSVSNGPNGSAFDFTFQKRSSSDMITQLGIALVEIVTLVPDGVVVFFPSYAYLALVLQLWHDSLGNSGSRESPIYTRLQSLKPIFEESRSENAEATLSAYTSTVTSGRGAILFSVIGGKMSEGINFSDKLGRCVILVGMPYPNPNTAEWRAKSAYIVDKAVKGGKTLQQGKDEAREFYENKAMRAVSQSVGRAIRHKDDWAAILLFDQRFAGDRVKRKLPGWIRDTMDNGSAAKRDWGMVMKDLRGFFEGKR